VTSIIVVGAGIGGLSLALELHARGHPCRIFEAAPSIKPVGVGLNILPYASRELHRLGLDEELGRASMMPRWGAYASRAGQVLLREPLGIASGSSFPQYSIHRASLQDILLRAVQRRLGEDAILLGHGLTRFEQDADEVRAIFNDRITVHGDILVGCDGIHSAVYRQLYPEGACLPLRPSGVTMWRGITRNISMLGQETVLRCGRIETGKLVAYPVRQPDTPEEIVMNWVAELRDRRDSTKHQKEGMPSTVPDIFLSWKFDWFDVEFLVRNAEFVLQLPMVDRDPLQRWSHGRVTLLGDAAHPMYPVGSNGAGQAILDAVALADCLDMDDIVASLQAYDERRRPLTADIVRSDRAGGPDIVLDGIEEATHGRVVSVDTEVTVATQLRGLLDSYRRESGLASNGLSVASGRRLSSESLVEGQV